MRNRNLYSVVCNQECTFVLENRLLTTKEKKRRKAEYIAFSKKRESCWTNHVRDTLFSLSQIDPINLNKRTGIVAIHKENKALMFSKAEQGDRYIRSFVIQYWWRNQVSHNTTRKVMARWVVSGVLLSRLLRNPLDYNDLALKLVDGRTYQTCGSALVRVISLCFRVYGSCQCQPQILEKLQPHKVNVSNFMESYKIVLHRALYFGSSEAQPRLFEAAQTMLTHFDGLCALLYKDPKEKFAILMREMSNRSKYARFSVQVIAFFNLFNEWKSSRIQTKTIESALTSLPNAFNFERFKSTHGYKLQTEHADIVVSESLSSLVMNMKVSSKLVHELLVDKNFRCTVSNVHLYDMKVPVFYGDLDSSFWWAFNRELKEQSTQFSCLRQFIVAVENKMIVTFGMTEAFVKYFKLDFKSYVNEDDFCTRLTNLYNAVVKSVSENLHVCQSLWEKSNAGIFTLERLYCMCETIFYAVRCAVVEDINHVIDEIATPDRLEGMEIEKRIFEEKILSEFKTPSFNFYVFKSLRQMKLPIDEYTQLAIKIKPAPDLLVGITSTLFYMILLFDQYNFNNEVPETFHYDINRINVMRKDLYYFRTLFIFYPMVISNSLSILERKEMELDEEMYVLNVGYYRQAIVNELKQLQLKMDSLNESCQLSSNNAMLEITILDCFRNGMHASNLLTQFEIEFILNESVCQFSQDIWKKRFEIM